MNTLKITRLQSFTWTWTSIHLKTLRYSFSFRCKGCTGHWVPVQALITTDVVLPGSWQGRVLRDGQRHRWDCRKISLPGNTVRSADVEMCVYHNFIATERSLTAGWSAWPLTGPDVDCRLPDLVRAGPQEPGFSQSWIWTGTRLLWRCTGRCCSRCSGL